jgi:prepilin-type N-terminal cleavage/methylation domain-containing protein
MRFSNEKGLSRQSREGGYSLSEMMIVLVVMGIVTAIPAMLLTSAKVQFSRQTFIREFKSSLERARFDSIKRKPETKEDMAKVVIRANSYELVTYRNSSGAVDDTGVAQVAKTESKTLSASDGTLGLHSSSATVGFPVTLLFDARGEVSAFDANNDAVTTPVFVICEGNCATQTAENSTILMISPTGTVALLPGGSDVTPYAAPTSPTTIVSSSGINRLVTLSQ